MNLYVAAPLLVSGPNTVIVLEMDTVTDPASPQIQLEATPDFSGPGCDLADPATTPASGDVVAMFQCSPGCVP